MGDGKNGLHSVLREKRKSQESEEELPEDLSLKKQCTEMSDEESSRQMERRRRNKEAAEKSRKKRKEEFEKLQSENVRLNQEKCELAAMISALKEMLAKEHQDNKELQMKNDTLKRWIAKRAQELGLNKHNIMQRKETQPQRNGDHETCYSSDEASLDEAPILSSKEASPLKENAQSLPRVAQKPERNVPMLNTTASKAKPMLHTPWIVEENDMAVPEKQARLKMKQDENQENVTTHKVQSQEHINVPGDKYLYLPDGRVLIVQGSVLQTPSPPPSPPQPQNMPFYMPYNIGSQKPILGGDTQESLIGSPNVLDSNSKAAIEALLKLGYEVKISHG